MNTATVVAALVLPFMVRGLVATVDDWRAVLRARRERRAARRALPRPVEPLGQLDRWDRPQLLTQEQIDDYIAQRVRHPSVQPTPAEDRPDWGTR